MQPARHSLGRGSPQIAPRDPREWRARPACCCSLLEIPSRPKWAQRTGREDATRGVQEF